MIEDRTRHLLDVRLASDQASQRLPSVAAGLARDGEIVWTGARGKVAGHRPDAGTQYRAGSITKTFVAASVMKLRDAGRLSLSDPVGNYLDPGVARAAGAMTIGQLLSHSAGLRAETAGLLEHVRSRLLPCGSAGRRGHCDRTGHRVPRWGR